MLKTTIRMTPLRAALVAAGLIGTTAAVGLAVDDAQNAPVRDTVVAAAPANNAALPATPFERRTNAPDYSAIVQKYGPAVVGVTVQGTYNVAASHGDRNDDEDAAPQPQM